MNKKAMAQALPQKIHSRKDEITAGFLGLAAQHITDLLNHRVERRYHASDFAALLFIHPRHLTNTIRLTTGRSPCDIIEESILNEAKKLLEGSDLSIADIGYRFAYNDPTNFTKFFKGMTGISPLHYRKNNKPQ